MRSIVVGIFVSILLLGGVLFWQRMSRSTQPLSSPSPSVPDSSLPTVPSPVSTAHAISLPAFSQRNFRGENLRLGRILDQAADFTRYAITYASGDLTISGVMEVPRRGDGPFPVIIANHGYIDPAVYTIGRGLRREHDFLARRGYVVVHPDYRNHADSSDDPSTDRQFRLGYAEDVVNAVKAVQASDLPFLDRERIGMLGHSMGGGVALTLLVTQPNLVDAVVLYAPVSADARDNFERWTTRRPALAREIAEAYGTPTEQPAFWDNISPLTFLKNVAVPVVIHHGTRDDSVPLAWSQRLEGALREQGKDVTLHVYEGEVHEFVTQWTTFMERTADFFDAHLR